MRRLGLSLVLAIVGLGLIAGSVIHFLPTSSVPTSLQPLDRYVGTQGSVVGAVFGLGLLLAALNPHRNLNWVYLGVAYGVLLVAAELWTSRDLAGIVWGLATAALLLALHPTRPRRPAVVPGAPPPPPAEPAGVPARPLPTPPSLAAGAEAEIPTPQPEPPAARGRQQPRFKPGSQPPQKEGNP